MNAPASVLQRLGRSRFAILLVCLLGLFVIHPMLPQRPGGGDLVHLDAALGLVLLGSLASLSHRRSVIAVGVALVAAALAAVAIARAAPDRVTVIIALLAAIAALLFTIVAVLAHVVREKQVSSDAIVGGICAYFLLGAVWALIYSLLERLDPGALESASGAVFGGEPWAGVLVPDLLYYSVFVLTTIGPQLLHPVSGAARAWTGLEAMTGQLFLAVFIARLVGLHASRPTTPGTK